MAAQTSTGEIERLDTLNPPKKRVYKRKKKTTADSDSKTKTIDLKSNSAPKSKSKPKSSTTRKKAKAVKNTDTLPGSAALRREALGLLVILGSLCVFLALVSFDAGNSNLIGPFGGWMASSLLFMFGIGAFFFNAVLWILGIAMVLGKTLKWRVQEVVGQLLFVIAGTILSHMVLFDYVLLGNRAGGLVGEIVGELLRSVLGTVGTTIVTAGFLLLGLMLITQLSLGDVTRKIIGWGHLLLTWIKHKFAVHKEYRVRLNEEREKIRIQEAKRTIAQEARSEAALAKRPILENSNYAFEGDFDDEVESKLAKKLGRFFQKTDKPVKKARRTKKEKINVVQKKITAEVERDSDWEMGSTIPDSLEPSEIVSELEVSKSSEALDLLKESKAPAILVSGKAADFGPQIVESVGTKNAKEKEALMAESDGAVFRARNESNFQLPSVSLLNYEAGSKVKIDPELLRQIAIKIETTLADFKVDGSIVEICPGPVITMFEFRPAPGVRVSKISGLSDDLAMALAATSIRIVAPIPGKSVVGIEVPNPSREMVYMKEVITDDLFMKNTKMKLPMALGVDVEGASIVADLAKMPHLLVAGATGSGKSVAVNTMIISLLYRNAPEDLRMIMVDPKMLEFSLYEDIPHLLLPVVTDPAQATVALNWAVVEMERRYQKLADLGVRNLDGYNKKVKTLTKQAELDQLNGLEESDAFSALAIDENGEAEHIKMPYIVVVVDEFADLMMTASKDVETAVARLAQKARASGIHLILATQRPSTDVVTGLIKANFPTRIALRVGSKIDSRVILDSNGAENLLGNGDMLFVPPGSSSTTRVHGAYVSEEEIDDIVAHLKEQGQANYDVSILEVDEDKAAILDEDRDQYYEDAVRIVIETRKASISMIQRKLRVGYNRAARMVEMMEAEGLVSPAFGCKPREVLVDELPY